MAVMGVDRSDVDADVDEADEATSTQAGAERGEHPSDDPPGGGKGGCSFGIAHARFPPRSGHLSVPW